MSAFVVDDNHIHALITWASRAQWQSPAYYSHGLHRYTFFDNQDKIGQVLVNANYASVNKRYSGVDDVPPEYKFTRYSRPLTPIQVIKACDGYNYQSCEVGWKVYRNSEAYTIINTIRERAIDELPGMVDADTWHISN